jgi:hypothetical protein
MKSINMAQSKMLFGFCLLLCIAALAATIAIGHVRQDTSYGLEGIISGLLTLSGGFANWAFGESRTSTEDSKENLTGRLDSSQRPSALPPSP